MTSPRSLALLVLLLSSPALGCGGGTDTPDAARRDAAGGAMDDATTIFPDAATGETDAFSADDAPSSDDAGSTSDDAASASDDASAQTDAGSGGPTCGGRGGTPCARGTFCNFPPSSICGRADGPGVCTAIPTSCTRELAPVCGCDGITYSNACEAARASVSVETTGACPVRCDPDLVVCSDPRPRCVVGTTPSVEGGCWTGECVAVSECTCTTFDDCPMITGYSEVCYTRGFCGPAL